jgi:hypothetical protein
MNIDLDDIERRINDGIYGDDRMSDTARDDAFSALAVLLAEVERLRGEVERERAAVVAWLRTRSAEIENWPPGGMNEISLTYDIVALATERAEHRREGGE